MLSLVETFKASVQKSWVKMTIKDEAVMPEMEKLGWSHSLLQDDSVFPLYRWMRPDGTGINVRNLGHTEAPPSDDATWKQDWKVAKDNAVNKVLGLELN